MHNKTVDRVLPDYLLAAVSRGANHPLEIVCKIANLSGTKRDYIFDEKVNNLKMKLILGEKDPMIDLDELEEATSGHHKVGLTIIKGAGHVPSIERTQKYNTAVLQYLCK